MQISGPTNDTNTDLHTITNMISALERAADTNLANQPTLHTFQQKLDLYAKVYQHTESAGSQRFKLYELQALLLLLQGDQDGAHNCLLQAYQLMTLDDVFVSNTAKDWLVLQSDERTLRPRKSAILKLHISPGGLLVAGLISYGIGTAVERHGIGGIVGGVPIILALLFFCDSLASKFRRGFRRK